MKKFWTVTDWNTQNTNSRSTRFDTEDRAVKEATRRVENGVDGVYVLEAVKFVRRKQQPIEVIDVTSVPLIPRCESDIAHG